MLYPTLSLYTPPFYCTVLFHSHSYTLFITLSPHLSLSSALSLNALSFSIPTFYILVFPCLPLSKTLPCILSLSPCQYSLTISVLSPLPLFDSSPSFSLSLSPYPLSLSCPLVVSLCPPSHSPIYLSQTHLPLTLLSLTGLLLTLRQNSTRRRKYLTLPTARRFVFLEVVDRNGWGSWMSEMNRHEGEEERGGERLRFQGMKATTGCYWLYWSLFEVIDQLR